MLAGPSFAILLLMSLGGGRAEFLSLFDADHYFQSRGIDVKGDALIRLAGTAGKDGRGEIAQLLAIRTLGERKDASAKAALEEVVRTQKGFAREYAEIALAQIAGRPPPATAPAKDFVRKGGLAWFPADVAIFGAAAPAALGGLSDAQMRAAVRKMIPDDAWDEIYKAAEQTGNLRIDRIAMAYSPEPKDLRGRIFIRITGKGNVKRLVALLKEAGRRFTEMEEGDIIRVQDVRPPVIAFIGDSEMIIAGYSRDTGLHRELLDQMLAVRAGTKPSVLKGVFSKDLAALSENALAVVVGSVFEDMRKELASSPLGVVPNNFVAEAVAVDAAGVRIRGRVEFDSAEDAKRAVDAAVELKKQGLDELARAEDRNDRDLKPEMIKTFRAALESLSFKNEGAVVKAELTIPAGLPQAVMQMFFMARTVGARPAPAPEVLKRP